MINSALANGAAAISWRNTRDVTPDELAASRRKIRDRGGKPNKPPAQERTRAWPRAQLGGRGNALSDDHKSAARRESLDWNRMHRAAKDEGVYQLRIRTYPGHKVWCIP